jgi:hypothetical protein
MGPTVEPVVDACRSQRESVLWEIPTSLAKAEALMASRPVMRRTMRALKPEE